MKGFRIFLFCLAIPLFSACTTKLNSLKLDKDVELEKEQGYLLISVETNINLHRFTIDGEQKVRLTEPDKHQGRNYYLVPIDAGDYWIRSIDSGYFFYSRYNFDDEEGLWSFSVEPNVINYVGEFKARHLWHGVSRFVLLNNSSIALEYLEEKYPKILAKRQVKYLGPGEDKFLEFALKHKNNQ